MDIKSKRQIREEIRKRRRESPIERLSQDSEKINAAFLTLPEYEAAQIVFAYMDCNHEVQTGMVIEQCWRDGKTLALPKVFGNLMKYYAIHSYEDLEKGHFGIWEPKYQGLPEVFCENGLMILPGVAFDLKRHRIGYGGGFYDRYLQNCPNMKTVAFAFEFQIYEGVPYEIHDRKPEKIITEKRIIV